VESHRENVTRNVPRRSQEYLKELKTQGHVEKEHYETVPEKAGQSNHIFFNIAKYSVRQVILRVGGDLLCWQHLKEKYW